MDRICECGRAFRGSVALCLPCRKTRRTRERECACGVVFVGDRTECQHCLSLSSKKYYEDNKQVISSKHREKRFSLEPGWYERRLAELDGRCAACGELPSDSRALSVDHDHSCCDKKGTVADPICGACVRDLLCVKCNTVLGLVGDDIEVLMSISAYLLRFQNLLVPESSEH